VNRFGYLFPAPAVHVAIASALVVGLGQSSMIGRRVIVSKSCVLAIDQGTTNTCAMLFDASGL